VRPLNGTELVEQWTDVNGTDQTPDVSDTVAGYPHRVYGGTVEFYSITGMNHGQPVDPGTGTTQCGATAAYLLDVNVCAAYHLARFWGIDGGATPTTTSGGNPTTTTARPPYTDAVTATATDHYVAGRIDVGEYNTLGVRYGYTTPFALYLCGAEWTDKADCSSI
jgi:hypothetical protein